MASKTEKLTIIFTALLGIAVGILIFFKDRDTLSDKQKRGVIIALWSTGGVLISLFYWASVTMLFCGSTVTLPTKKSGISGMFGTSQ